jgi:hypothetical protein
VNELISLKEKLVIKEEGSDTVIKRFWIMQRKDVMTDKHIPLCREEESYI